MTITAKKISDHWLALGVAAHFLAKRAPFAKFSASDLIGTLDTQIRRGHYLFAFDSSAKGPDARVVGYLGWALYDNATAERFATAHTPPADQLLEGGDVIWVLTSAAEDRRAFFALAKAARALYPRHRVMGIRHKPGGKRVVFDQKRDRASIGGPG